MVAKVLDFRLWKPENALSWPFYSPKLSLESWNLHRLREIFLKYPPNITIGISIIVHLTPSTFHGFKTRTGKNYPQIKLQRFWQVWIWTLRWLIHHINSLHKVLKLKQNFRKCKVVTGKNPFFMWYNMPILYSYLASDREVLCGRVAFSVLVLSTKKWYFSFLKRNCVFQKNCFKVKVLKRFEISNDCHIKHADLSKGALF